MDRFFLDIYFLIFMFTFHKIQYNLLLEETFFFNFLNVEVFKNSFIIIIIIIIFYFTILYWFCHTSTWICHGCTRVPNPEHPSYLRPQHHPSGSSQYTSPKHLAPCIEPRLAIHFLYDIIHVSMPFSQIIPPSPSPSPFPIRVRKTALYICPNP